MCVRMSYRGQYVYNLYLSHFEAGLQKIVALVSCEHQLALHCFWLDLVVTTTLLVEIGGRVILLLLLVRTHKKRPTVLWKIT